MTTIVLAGTMLLTPTLAAAQFRRMPTPIPQSRLPDPTPATDWGRSNDPLPRGKNIFTGCENRGKSRNERHFCRDMGLPTAREHPRR